jgi:hypothetical protein
MHSYDAAFWAYDVYHAAEYGHRHIWLARMGRAINGYASSDIVVKSYQINVGKALPVCIVSVTGGNLPALGIWGAVSAQVRLAEARHALTIFQDRYQSLHVLSASGFVKVVCTGCCNGVSRT